MTVDAQMLSTLELLHYCQRFRDTLFAFVFERSRYCEDLLMDLRVLHAAGIRQVLFCAADTELVKKLGRWNRSGYKFLVLEGTQSSLRTAAFIGRLQTELRAGNVPLVTLSDYPADEPGQLEMGRAIMHCAVALGARKAFFPGEAPGLILNGRFRSYPGLQEIREAREANLSPERLAFILEQQEEHLVDLVLLPARRGAIFEEVFTHSGAGTLFAQDYTNVLRAASETDVRDIIALMQPYVDEGTLKPVSEEELLEMIRSFMVYSVNGQIVAAGALLDYEDCCEVGKLCTLPRYQARGRARDLVRALQEEAALRGKRAVFALTVSPKVAEFFEKLGFREVPRETLPESWQASYDFSRPSRAFWSSLGKSQGPSSQGTSTLISTTQ